MKPRVDGISAGAEIDVGHLVREHTTAPGKRMGAGTTDTSVLRIGVAGCGKAARIHLDRLLALDGVAIVGCADPDRSAAEALADRVALASEGGSDARVPCFGDHRELLRSVVPDAVAVFTPHLAHYRVTMDALQAGCHVFIEKPLSTNLQEAAEIVGLAKARDLKVGVGHQFRLCPSLIEARQRIIDGVIGPVRLVTGTLARPWLTTLPPAERSWRSQAKQPGGGMLADVGDHLIDALLWTTRQPAREVAAVQSERDAGIDIATAACIRLADGTPVTLAISGVSPGSHFALDYFGESGRLTATDQTLEEERTDTPWREVALPGPSQTIDGNFVAALANRSALCCPADQALDTVRLLEAVGRSAATGEVVRLI
jgi:predicted dehydrogenase